MEGYEIGADGGDERREKKIPSR